MIKHWNPKQHKDAYTQDEKREIIEAAKNGATVEQLQTISNRPACSILYMLKQHGYTLSDKPYNLEKLR